jgi:hypothetical protein
MNLVDEGFEQRMLGYGGLSVGEESVTGDVGREGSDYFAPLIKVDVEVGVAEIQIVGRTLKRCQEAKLSEVGIVESRHMTEWLSSARDRVSRLLELAVDV